tara:strand:+ start:103 stop:285 length:183 start_codon:yes stop_codon:yes gene_type:complete
MYSKKPKNVAGIMGQQSNQVIKGMSFSKNVNPMERLMQKVAGKNQGKFELVKKKRKPLVG